MITDETSEKTNERTGESEANMKLTSKKNVHQLSLRHKMILMQIFIFIGLVRSTATASCPLLRQRHGSSGRRNISNLELEAEEAAREPLRYDPGPSVHETDPEARASRKPRGRDACFSSYRNLDHISSSKQRKREEMSLAWSLAAG